MDIILLQDVDTLGTAGDIVNVKPGYARNYLFPRSLALRASKRNLAIADERKRNADKRRNHDKKMNLELSEQLKDLEMTFEVQVGEEEKMFGAVTTNDIHKKLEEKGIAVERHRIELKESIKALGIYHIPVRVSAEMKPELKVYVIKT
ncbi:MAG TPA: 50S ribosomal protein L9 [Candidatus Marinimicrobia bacterium]|nr:50S ribosomal protein L9 [Candidatus Neomarinimicrobiota bacterium]HJM69301.1 50S ribosomal protein L9 [Candidatus Neomarinimicrobiota bacterium]|tara:strand:- start:6454 stop:6897 length:444 start_codon:yes stop_codon:yes gene_type:complete